MKSGREEIPACLCAWRTAVLGAHGMWSRWWKPFISADVQSCPIALLSWCPSDSLWEGWAYAWRWVAWHQQKRTGNVFCSAIVQETGWNIHHWDKFLGVSDFRALGAKAVPPLYLSRSPNSGLFCGCISVCPIVLKFPAYFNVCTYVLGFFPLLMYFAWVFFLLTSSSQVSYVCVLLSSQALQMLSSFPSHMEMCGSLFLGCDPLFSAMCSWKLCSQAAESYLKDLPFYFPLTFKFKDWSRVYLSVMVFSSFWSLSEICIRCKYNNLKSENHCYLVYKSNCNVHVSHWGQASAQR